MQPSLRGFILGKSDFKLVAVDGVGFGGAVNFSSLRVGTRVEFIAEH